MMTLLKRLVRWFQVFAARTGAALERAAWDSIDPEARMR